MERNNRDINGRSSKAPLILTLLILASFVIGLVYIVTPKDDAGSASAIAPSSGDRVTENSGSTTGVQAGEANSDSGNASGKIATTETNAAGAGSGSAANADTSVDSATVGTDTTGANSSSDTSDASRQ